MMRAMVIAADRSPLRSAHFVAAAQLLLVLGACSHDVAWSGPLAARADSATAGRERTCVSQPVFGGSDSVFGDAILVCRVTRGRDTAVVYASPNGRVYGLNLYHVRPRAALTGLADKVVRAARHADSHLIRDCPHRKTAGAWVWRDTTFDYDVEIETKRNAVRESVWIGDSPMTLECGRGRHQPWRPMVREDDLAP